MMPRKIGEIVPDRISFTFTPINLRDIQESMNSKEFPNVANLINTALRFYYENRNKPSQIEEVKKWLMSEEGAGYLKKVMNEIDSEDPSSPSK